MQPPEDLRCVSLRGGAVGLKLERGRSEHLLSWKQERDSAAEGEVVSSRKMERSMPQMLLPGFHDIAFVSLEFGLWEATELHL